jgi:hypothetical protein
LVPTTSYQHQSCQISLPSVTIFKILFWYF